ncbi:unnamed protein product [Nesidiocoris tenuis]|uniref:Uncharacterized protein n=1 Tax=Nesidiocoris tenuis TaxID=355587 RepID=A0A6H5HQV5_9HEMI|nr:unnamed protein product [Nesidiocoris tenuis]
MKGRSGRREGIRLALCIKKREIPTGPKSVPELLFFKRGKILTVFSYTTDHNDIGKFRKAKKMIRVIKKSDEHTDTSDSHGIGSVFPTGENRLLPVLEAADCRTAPLPPEPRGCAVRPPLRRQDPGTPLDSWIRVGRNGHKTDSNRENAGRPRLTSEAGMPPAGSITSRATAAASYPSGCPCDGSLTGFHHDDVHGRPNLPYFHNHHDHDFRHLSGLS